MINAPFAVIFDMDGVLINSHGYVRESFNLILAHHGITMDQMGDDWRGRSLPDLLQAIKANHGLAFTVEMFDDAARLQEERMRADGVQADPALVTLLDELKTHGVPVGLGTSSPRRRMNRLLGVLGLTDWFTVTVCEEDIDRHKPHPDVFLAVAERLGVAPKRCIVIEDAVSGIVAAQRAGMKTVGFTAFHEPGYALGSTTPDLTIESFYELTVPALKALVR